MKKCGRCLLICALVLAIAVIFLNFEVTTLQGVNYKVHAVKMPLYLKILDFYDRHYNYKNLVNKIVDRNDTGAERAIKLLQWTHDNIKENPKELPVVDDHVWYTIVRGYATGEQFSDVFTTLCNYAGIKAFFNIAYNKDRTSGIFLSFLKVDGRWTAVDAYNAVYFEEAPGKLAGIGSLKRGNYLKKALDRDVHRGIDYNDYLSNLKEVNNSEMTRPNIQSPFNRFIFQVKKQLGYERP